MQFVVYVHTVEAQC